jgi:zona occludens toxin
MIIVHEGLPGSGKSYEAAVNQIIPALLKSRKVFAYIEGLNHQKFAEITGLSLERVNELLIQITKEQVPTIYDHVDNDSLVVIDELQDFFPSHKKQLTPQITEFVTQHRHRGIDMVVMGQSHKDFSVLWKRRIDMLISFMKRDALGMPTSYTWVTKKLQGERFVKIRSGGGKYDPKYFGLYASHNDGVEAIDVHSDDRTNIFKSAAFRFWIPLFGVLLLVAIYYLYGVFHGDGFVKSPEPKKTAALTSVQPVQQSAPQVLPQKTVEPPKPPEKPPEVPELTQEQLNTYKGFLDVYFKKYRPRLAAFIHTKATDIKPARDFATIEFYDDEKHLKDSFNLLQLTELGYTFRESSLGLIVKGGGGEYVVKAWKLDGCDGKYCDRTNRRSESDGNEKDKGKT